MTEGPTERVLDAEAGEAPVLRLHDLGALGVEVGGVRSPLRGAKLGRILSALLINANRRVTIDALLDAVWGDEVTDSSPGTLETHIWRLRKLIEPPRERGAELTYLVNDSHGYRLVVNPENADSLRFAQLGEQGDRLLGSGDADRALHRYELALDLWRGRPFEPVADEEWAAPAIARLDQIYGQVNEQRIEALLRIGAVDRAVSESETLIGRLPYRERLWGQLMLGLYQAGRVEESLAAYHRARDVLLDTLGVDPGDELRELQQRILDRAATLAPPRPAVAVVSEPPPDDGTRAPDTQAEIGAEPEPDQGSREPGPSVHEVHLPSRLSPLIGRSSELHRIGGLLAASRLVTLVGAAGSGKTRLAIEVARTASGVAPDGVWFIDLAAVEDSDAVVGTVLSTIGIQQPPVGTALAALRSYVRDRQILLLVDNCEHVLAGVYPLFDAVLGEDSQCRILATSREPVGLDGEVLWTLAPLPVHESGQAAGDEASPAAQLFLARATSADPLFETTEETLSEVEAICTAVDGIPLAIELAAGRIRSASLVEVRHQVDTELAGLGRAGYAGTEHHRTVELSIQWSVRLLSEAERAAHARLSVLPGFFTVEAAEAVAGEGNDGVDPLRPRDVQGLLTQLVHHSLVTAVPAVRAGEPTRFRQLATVRAHAVQALASAGETQATFDRRDQWVAGLVAARPAPEAEDETGWHEAVERNHDTVAATLRHLLQDRPDPLGVRIVGQLESYWWIQGRVSEGERWLQAALLQQDAPAADVATVELTLAFMLTLRGRLERTPPLVRSALGRASGMDRRLLAQQLTLAAWGMWLGEDPDLDFVDAEVRALSEGDPVIEAWADLLAAKTGLAVVGPEVTGVLAAELVDRSERVGNIHAAWLATRLAARSALMTGEATTGLSRLRHVISLHQRLGGRVTSELVEFEACFMVLAGDQYRAAQLFGQSDTLAFRAGTNWPITPTAEKLLGQVRDALPDDQFNSAWQAGVARAASTD